MKQATKQAIDGKRLNAFAVPPEELVIIGLDTDDGAEHPLYDERILAPLSETTVLNMMVHGVIEPVKVTKDGDRILVVAGRQRVRHAREANARLRREGSATIDVPVMIQRGDTATLYGVMVSENEHRLADEVLAKARKVQRYLAFGKTEAEAAVTFNCSRSTIRNWLALLESPEAQAELRKTGQAAKAYERARGKQRTGPSRSERIVSVLERVSDIDVTEGQRVSAKLLDLLKEIIADAQALLSESRKKGK